jgi:hypothetical protein
MEWFTRTTSIGGTSIPNWVLVLIAVIIIWLIYRFLASFRTLVPKHPPGPPMDSANMRRQGVRNLVAYCLNDSCRHQALIDVSSYPGDTPVPWFRSGEVRQVRRCAEQPDRRAAELERGTGRPAMPDGE